MANEQIRLNEIDEFFIYRHGYPRPDWERIFDWVEALPPDSDFHHIWTEILAKWLGKLSDHLQDNYSIWESLNFLIVCNRPKADSERLTRFCERARKRIPEILGHAAADGGYGKIVVLILSDADDYYDYIGDWYPEDGDFGGTSGMCLSGGCSHIAVSAGLSLPCESIISHELNHLYLTHLDLPLWLNEGITQIVEREIAGWERPGLDVELSRKHAKWWNPETIQSFWSGEAFSAPDDLQEMSYDLALQMANHLLRKFPSTFADLLKSAISADAGDAALWATCKYSLNQCVADILGNQDWTPRLPPPNELKEN